MLRVILFDFDGIIVDAEPVHLRAFQEVLAKTGITLSEDDYYGSYLAMDDRTLISTVLRDRKRDFDESTVEGLMQSKSEGYERLIREGIKIFPGVVDFVNSVSKRYLLGIGSGALRHEIEFILDYIGLKDRFGVVVSAEDVEKCKPDPEVFTKALREINDRLPHDSSPVYPSECLVIEDSFAGIRAAKLAGMKTLAITNSYDSRKLCEADLIANSLSEVEIEKLEEIFRVP